MPTPRAPGSRSALALVDVDDLIEHRNRLVTWALEGVAADDRPGSTARCNLADFAENAIQALGFTAGEHHQTTTVEARLHNVLNPLGQR